MDEFPGFDVGDDPGIAGNISGLSSFGGFMSEARPASPQIVVQPQVQPPGPSFKKTKWTPEEDKLLIDSVKKNGMSNWSLVANEVKGRTGKQCRERWTNQLCPALNKDNWTPQEDQILIKQQQVHGNFWSKIARYLPGRSPNAVKNRWSWLSRHKIPSASLAHQMMPFRIGTPTITRHSPIPMPQIYQTQQTAPQDTMWGLNGSTGSLIAFSEPNATASSLGPAIAESSSMIFAGPDIEPSTPDVVLPNFLNESGSTGLLSFIDDELQNREEDIPTYWDAF